MSIYFLIVVIRKIIWSPQNQNLKFYLTLLRPINTTKIFILPLFEFQERDSLLFFRCEHLCIFVTGKLNTTKTLGTRQYLVICIQPYTPPSLKPALNECYEIQIRSVLQIKIKIILKN
jgi:hypothetical protein